MKLVCKGVLWWFVLIFSLMSWPSIAKTPDKVLFVGNSFSFYNNGIHNNYASLIRAEGKWTRSENRVRLKTLSGSHIHEHLSGLATYLSEDKRGWDAVVLQGHSNEPILENKRKRFEIALSKAVSLIQSRKIEPILFMSWGYKGNKEMGHALKVAYLEQAQKLGVKLVPVGVAFAEAEMKLPQIELFVPDVLSVDEKDSTKLTYRKDWKHPSPEGTYLAACVFYASLQGRSPEGNIFRAGLKAETAAALQQLSWEVVTNFTMSTLPEQRSRKRN